MWRVRSGGGGGANGFDPEGGARRRGGLVRLEHVQLVAARGLVELLEFGGVPAPGRISRGAAGVPPLSVSAMTQSSLQFALRCFPLGTAEDKMRR